MVRKQTVPPDPPSNLVDPMESISSMKIIDGACSLKLVTNRTDL